MADSLRGKEVEYVMEEHVIPHVDGYACSQYGDKGNDLLTKKNSRWCFDQVEKYLNRVGTNQRGLDDQKLDILKMIHYLCVAYVKFGEENENT